MTRLSVSLFRTGCALLPALLSFTFLSPVGAQAPRYAITDLGAVGGGTYSSSNQAGQVVGYGPIRSGRSHAVLLSRGQLTDLGTLGGDDSSATDINDSGQITGNADTTPLATGSRNTRAFLYSGGRMINLGVLPGGRESRGYGINNSGQVVGVSQVTGGSHAFLYSSGRLTDLKTLPGGTSSSALGINDFGAVVGYSNGADGKNQAVVFRNGQVIGLGTLPGGGRTYAVDVNNSGQVTGTAFAPATASTPAGDHAFLYSGGRMKDLGVMPGFLISFGSAINNFGVVVGSTYKASGPPRAFIYGGGTMTDLNTRIAPGSPWVLQQVFSITDGGKLVGQGTYNGQIRAFLLSPIAAASLTLNPSAVFGGAPSTATVTLNAPAPSGGQVVSVSSNTAYALVPSTLTVPAGATSKTFTVTTKPVAVRGVATIRVVSGGIAQYANLNVAPVIVKALVLSSSSVKGGQSVRATIGLTGPAPPGGVTVFLSTNSASALVPATVTVPGGLSTIAFTVTTNTVRTTLTADIAASLPSGAKHAFLTITP